MSLKLRLSRAGSKKRPYYHIVVTDVRAPRDGRFIERIGAYNPMLPKDREDRITLNAERVQHWLSVGARPTDRVARFLDAEGLFKREQRNNPEKAKPGKKAQERLEERAAAAAEAEEAKKAAAEAPAEEEAAAETPAEEAPAEEAPAEEEKAAE